MSTSPTQPTADAAELADDLRYIAAHANDPRNEERLYEAADEIDRLVAENERLSKAVCSGILGDLLAPDENEALVAFVKELRAAKSGGTA
jgi:hypothetical protein